jgi:hypothetical protein
MLTSKTTANADVNAFFMIEPPFILRYVNAFHYFQYIRRTLWPASNFKLSAPGYSRCRSEIYVPLYTDVRCMILSGYAMTAEGNGIENKVSESTTKRFASLVESELDGAQYISTYR